MRIKVGVIFGGETVEHEVSIITAVQAMNAMDKEEYEVIPIYIAKDREWYTGEMLKDIEMYKDFDLIKKYAKKVVLYEKNGNFVLQSKGVFKGIVTDIDIAFPICHGTNVEDGALQGYLQTIGIPYVGPNVYAAAVGQDKVYQKQIWENAGVPIVNYTWFYDVDYKRDADAVIKKVSKLKFPVIVKPATCGSSIGIKTAKTKNDLDDAISEAIQYDNKIIVEEMVSNLKEVNISVLGNYDIQKTSIIEEVLSDQDFLTYEEKYLGGKKGKRGVKGGKMPVKGRGPSKGMLSCTRTIAKLNDKTQEKIETVAVDAFRALGSSGCARLDFMIDQKTNKVYLNEINSIPGSLAFYLWEPKEIKYNELLDEMINIGIKDYRKRSSKTHSFDSNILEGMQNVGVKGMKGSIKGKLQ